MRDNNKYIRIFCSYKEKSLKDYLKLFDKFVDKKIKKKNDLDFLITKALIPSFMSKSSMKNFIKFLLENSIEDEGFYESFNNFQDVFEVRFETYYNVHLDMESNDVWKILSREFKKIMKYVDYLIDRVAIQKVEELENLSLPELQVVMSEEKKLKKEGKIISMKKMIEFALNIKYNLKEKSIVSNLNKINDLEQLEKIKKAINKYDTFEEFKENVSLNFAELPYNLGEMFRLY